MTPEAAVYWRVICEELQASANAYGGSAATALGQQQAVSAAAAGEKLEALESALPATASDLLAGAFTRPLLTST
jgi:condensin complex subunit 3